MYASTSGVYGDCSGAWVHETRAPQPLTDRARRRVNAEASVRAFARALSVRATVLRVPRITRAQAAQHFSAAQLSFLNESRRLDNTRMKRELRVTLRYPSVESALRGAAPERPLKHPASA